MFCNFFFIAKLVISNKKKRLEYAQAPRCMIMSTMILIPNNTVLILYIHSLCRQTNLYKDLVHKTGW